MKKNYKCRVTIIMAILSLLFGCSGNKKYNAGDIIGAVVCHAKRKKLTSKIQKNPPEKNFLADLKHI